MNIPYTLLIDETGFDGASKKSAFVGCLIETSDLTDINQQIVSFNQASLDDPELSYKIGFVNNIDEARHFSEDHYKIHDSFVGAVVSRIPCRVYAVYKNTDSNTLQLKKELINKLIEIVKATKRVKQLDVIAESSEDDKVLELVNVTFRDKSFLPLSIVDYYAAILHKFHEQRLLLLTKKDAHLKQKDLNSPVYHHYQLLMDRVSLEIDLSTGNKSGRQDGYYFWKQIESIIVQD
jgi:hypothetical protein